MPRPFIKGPIYVDWLQKAFGVNGKAAHVALAIHYLHGMSRNKQKPLKLTHKVMGMFGVTRQAANRVLRDFEMRDLIQLTMKPGCSPGITLLHQSRDIHMANEKATDLIDDNASQSVYREMVENKYVSTSGDRG